LPDTVECLAGGRRGRGGVPVFAPQLAQVLGAQVTAAISIPEKAERFRALGASDVTDYRHTPIGRSRRAR
jgi:NADPH:quinone reductase-like Zn-dependent oxidoreductase